MAVRILVSFASDELAGASKFFDVDMDIPSLLNKIKPIQQPTTLQEERNFLMYKLLDGGYAVIFPQTIAAAWEIEEDE
jgi:hypothetical protein